MSAKRFISPVKAALLALRAAKRTGVIIVLLAISLVGAGCASLRPPVLETGDAVEAEVIETLHTKELEGNVPPEAMQTALAGVAQVLEIVASILGGFAKR